MTVPFLPLAAAVAVALPSGPRASLYARPLDDAQIADIAVTANQLDVEAARQAVKKSSSSVVQAFAKTMIRDHEEIIGQATALAKRLGITPKENETSRSLAETAKTTRENLSNVRGTAFDRAYMDNEVAYHKAVITAVEETLIPNTSNADLKRLLESVVPALEAHLKEAKRIAEGLKGS